MSKRQRSLLVLLASVALLVYTFYGSTMQGTEVEIKIDFWGLVAFILLMVLGLRWAGRGS